MVLQTWGPFAEVRAGDPVTVVHFAGGMVSLDDFTVGRIRDQLNTLAEGSGRAHLLLDFGNVQFVCSEALGVMVGLHKRLLARGRRLMLRDLTPLVHEVFIVTRLDQLIDVQPDWPPCPCPTGVLIADDEAAVRNVLEIGLRQQGFEVWSAPDGWLAVQLYDQYRDAIAVVLLDVRMPGLNGPETLAALKELSPTVRCCFLTGDPGLLGEDGLLRLGAVRVFRKPFVLDEVLETVAQLAGRPYHHGDDVWIKLPNQGA